MLYREFVRNRNAATEKDLGRAGGEMTRRIGVKALLSTWSSAPGDSAIALNLLVSRVEDVSSRVLAVPWIFLRMTVLESRMIS